MGEDELVVVVTDKDGNTKTLGSNEPDPGDRPRSITYSSQLGSGFYTAGFNLSCALDTNRDDIHLLDDVRIVTTGGDTRYEGFIAAMPRSTDADGRGTLTVTCAGYMATAAGQPFTMIFVDRDLSQWGQSSRTQRIANAASGYTNYDAAVATDQAAPAVRCGFVGPWAVGGLPVCSAMYDAGPGNLIGSVWYEWTRGANVSNADANWSWKINAMTSDNIASGQDTTANLIAAGPGANTLTTTAARRFAMVRLEYAAANPGIAGQEYALDWRNLTVYGTHGLTLRGTTSPQGVSASDVIGWLVDNYCPLLSPAGIQQTTYPIGHLAFRDRTTPYDAMLKVNSYHLWDLAVWEDRAVYYRPTDLDDWDYEVRHDEIGNQIGLQGDEYTTLRNGLVVQYTNVATGSLEELLPANYAQLRDDTIDNPFNQHGWTWYGEPFRIPYPTTLESALELGRIRLLEDNQPKLVGQFTLTNKVRDRSGEWVPVGQIRSGETIRITSSVDLSSRSRLIHEVQFSQDGRVATVAVDGTMRVLDAIMDRTTTALQAAGLS